jgi:hypothetical protein
LPPGVLLPELPDPPLVLMGAVRTGPPDEPEVPPPEPPGVLPPIGITTGEETGGTLIGPGEVGPCAGGIG